jgi:hypothetical protein
LTAYSIIFNDDFRYKPVHGQIVACIMT